MKKKSGAKKILLSIPARIPFSTLVTGKRVQGSWAHADEESSFYELKANVENILRRIGIAQNALTTEASDNNIFDKALTLKTRGGKTTRRNGYPKP